MISLTRPSSPRQTAWRLGALATAASLSLALVACGSGPQGRVTDGADGVSGTPSPTGAAGEQGPSPMGGPTGQARAPIDITTRNAVFKASTFEALPGWQQDNLNEAWAAFRESCKALERKPNWKKLCTEVRATRDAKAGRALIEREFTLLTVQNTDKSREGDITGYYEPLLNGRAVKGGDFVVPVYGVPNDMYFLDWKTVPGAQRKGVALVRPNGRLLVPALPGELGAVKVDLRRFTLDTLDRRLRVRLEGEQGLPYYTRSDIQRLGLLDAPVLAWVDDPIALYAMQVQGAGRVRMADGAVLRLQYADQNGQPFKPMQLAAQGNERIQTRGAASDAQPEEPEQFELASDAAEPPASGAGDEPLTRGGRKAQPSEAPSVDATVQSLLPTPAPSTTTATSATSVTKPPAGLRVQITPQGVQPLPGQSKGSAQGPIGSASPARPPASQDVVDALLPPGGKANAPRKGVAPVSRDLQAQRARALDADPSYVFFRVAPDLPQQAGPMGALGVPLTAGRSLAVDPRVLPLGYPVFLDAAGTERQQPRLQRLMFAQDTGGAIRGAVRADYFWGYGAEAGRQARQTRHRGRMWVMVPHAEVAQLLSSKLVTRGGTAVLPECLVPDDDHCAVALDADDEAASVSP